MKNQKRTIRELVLCGLFTALIAVGAFIKISIPIQPFPMNFTLQLFFTLLAGFLLGPRLGLLSVITYLILGLIGVPIFAAGGGLSYLIRPTFGFLLGFAFAAYLTGLICRKAPALTFRRLLLASVCGMMAYYISGMVYFYLISNFVINMPVTWGIVFINCFLLTVAGDLVLCLLASLLAGKLLPQIPKVFR